MSQPDGVYRKKLLEEFEKIPVEYRPSLFEIVRAFRESVTLKTAEESFRQGWKEAWQGETQPAAGLWNEDDGSPPRRAGAPAPQPDDGRPKKLPRRKVLW